MINIALVEDNEDLLDDVHFNLERAGYRVAGYGDGAALDAAMRQGFIPDILVLDLGLPGEDGLNIAERLRRSHPQIGIVMLTARTTLSDRIAGLRQGADNYLCKPVAMEELIAVIEARARTIPRDTGQPDSWQFDGSKFSLNAPDGQSIPLTTAEATLIRLLAGSHGQQANRAEIVAALGENYLSYDPRRLEAIVSRLRRKIAACVPQANPLRALRNQGYVFLDPLKSL